MLSLIVKISHIDYSSISDKIIPIILENKVNKENISLINTLTNEKGLKASFAGAEVKNL
jgi:hypothetical protein